MEFLIILLLVLLNGIFSMAEISLVSSRKFKLENAAKKGLSGAQTALEMSNDPTRLLSTVQIGITLIGILLGIYSGDKMTNDVQMLVSSVDILAPYSKSIAVTIVVLCITFVSIVLGELLPKRIGLTFPEPIAMILAKPMKLISKITAPFVWLLSFTNDILLKLLGIKANLDSKITEEEIKSIIQDSTEGGEIQEIEQDIVERVFDLGDRKVSALMTHKTDLCWIEIKEDWESVKKTILDEIHSAYPVCDEEIDNVLGVVMIKDLFAATDAKKVDIKKYLKTPIFIDENTSAYILLEHFKKEKMHYAIVTDEYGATKGFITMDDILDALIGDSSEANHEDEYKIVERDANSWLVDGQYSYFEMLRYFEIEEDKDDTPTFNTVGGLFISLLNNIPKEGSTVSFGDYSMEVIDMDKRRIDKLIIRKKQAED